MDQDEAQMLVNRALRSRERECLSDLALLL